AVESLSGEMSSIVSRRPSSRNPLNEAFWLLMRFGSSRMCFRREKLLRASGAAIVLLKCGASLGIGGSVCGCADLRPEPNSIAKRTVAAQAQQRDGPRYEIDYSPCVKSALAEGVDPRRFSRRKMRLLLALSFVRGLGEPGGSPREQRLLELDRGAGFFQLRLDLVGLFLRDAFLDRVRRAVDEVLGLLEAKSGDRADDLDHLDLLAAGL